MLVVDNLAEYKNICDGPIAVTLGKFDGFHIEHCKLVDRTVELAKEDGLKSVVITFLDMPSSLAKTTKYLMTKEEKRIFLKDKGVDILIECHFTDEIMHISPEDFIRKVLVDALKVKYVCVGENFTFGYKGAGDVEMLKEFSKRFDFCVQIEPTYRLHGNVLSSTAIRENLKSGNMKAVMEMLGHDYSLYGIVTRGNRLGHTIGIPTLNLYPAESKALPPFGVYATRVSVGDDTYNAVTNIGIRPTVEDLGDKNIGAISVESNILDEAFDRELYDEEIKVDLIEMIRPEEEFNSLDELKAAIVKDKIKALEILN